jgi:hypothetical protein
MTKKFVYMFLNSSNFESNMTLELIKTKNFLIIYGARIKPYRERGNIGNF